MEFTPQTRINLNPFTNLVIDDAAEDEAGASLKPVEAVVAQMCYSAMESATPTQLETTLISEAIRWAWATEGNDAGADTVYQYLAEFPAHATGVLETLGNKEEIIRAAQLLGLYMKNFLSSGPYGRYFNGRSTFDISQDEAVVLELEHLKPQIELFRVVTLQVINAVTADLYLSDRSRKRLVILDEAWQFLGSGGDSAQLRAVIESGYRRARKYGGSFTIISQSLLDLKQFGSIGNVINANSAFKFLLQSADFNEAHRQGLIDYDDFTMKRLNSTQSNAPKYSEIFLDCPFGRGHLRFSIDDFNYYVYTSDPQEVAEIESYVKEGLTYEQAIDRMVEKYRRPRSG
jgi:conjugal transfer ATP-binding protein TraC